MAETTGQYKSNLTPEEVDQALHNIAQLDDGIAQAKQYAEQAQGYAESINPGNFYTKEQADSEFAPYNHRSTTPVYGMANETYFGHVKLTDTPGDFAVNSAKAATPKCVQDAIQEAMTPQQITPTYENGFTDSSATRIFKIGRLVVCQFNILIPSISGGAWRGMLKIPGCAPVSNVNGRVATEAGGGSRDYLITVTGSDGELSGYFDTADSGNYFTTALVFICKE